METYSGGVFSPRIDGGRAGAALHLTGHALVAELRDGARFEIPFDRCRLSVGGASGNMWFCKAEEGEPTFYSEARAWPEALRRVPALQAQVDAVRAQQQVQNKRRAGMWAVGTLAFAVLLLGGYFGLQALGRAAVTALPSSVDAQIGDVAIATLDLGGPVVASGPAKKGVTQIVEHLEAHAPGDFEYRVQLVDAPVVNAFALPGGEIVVYTGLIKQATSPEQVAAVLAHEISHVTQRHGIERIAQSVGLATMIQLFLGDVSGLAALAIRLLQDGALTSYGREQEREADRRGLEMMHSAGLDPHAMAEMFRILKKQQPEVPAGLSWLSTHPDIDERIAEVAAWSDRMGAPATEALLPISFGAMRESLGAPLPGEVPAPGDTPSLGDTPSPGDTPSGGNGDHPAMNKSAPSDKEAVNGE